MVVLSCEQIEALLSHLQKHTYLYAKDIVAYVKITFGIEYNVARMTTWLHQHGFSYKKPAVMPGKLNKGTGTFKKTILHSRCVYHRYVKDDPEALAELEKIQADNDVARKIYDLRMKAELSQRVLLQT